MMSEEWDSILIVALDGLESDFVEKWNLRNLKQQEYGTIEVPIDSETGVPTSPQVWASFLTGRYVEGLEFEKVGMVNIVLKALEFLHKHIPMRLGLGEKVRNRAPSRFPTLKSESFLELTKSREINMPYYSYDHSALNIIHKFKAENLSVSRIIVLLKDLYEKRKSRILREIDKIESVDVFVAFMHFPDSLQHFLFTRPSKIEELYLDLDEYVSLLKKRIRSSTLFIIVSDHGFDLETGTHSKHGFYSSSANLERTPRKITDFFQIVTTSINLQRRGRDAKREEKEQVRD